jgi:hypothetical protein
MYEPEFLAKMGETVTLLHAKNRNERFWVVERDIDEKDVNSALRENMPHALPSEIKVKLFKKYSSCQSN